MFMFILYLQVKAINGCGGNYLIDNNLQKLKISGVGCKIIIKSHIGTIHITGTNNKVNGLDQNCLIDNLFVSGIGNKIDLNQNCSNVNQNIHGLENKIRINGNEVNSNNYGNNNGNIHFVNNNRVIINRNIINPRNIINSIFRNNENNNEDDDDNNDENNENDQEFQEKKKELILEMDEFQYKHIQKYDSRKETQCAICLSDFVGVDIIKSFYKCEHIFHKKCLLDWLKKSNICPLCKHDLKEDINQL